MGGGRHRDLIKPRGHELQPGHLRRGVLHRHPVGSIVDVGLAPFEFLIRPVEVVDQDLLGEGQRPAETFAGFADAPVECGVHPVDKFDWCARGNRHEPTCSVGDSRFHDTSPLKPRNPRWERSSFVPAPTVGGRSVGGALRTAHRDWGGSVFTGYVMWDMWLSDLCFADLSRGSIR